MRLLSLLKRRIVPLLAVCLLLPASSLYAQRYLGSVQGLVTDPAGAVISTASVTAEETTTHFKTIGKTNPSGQFSFPALNPGTYIVTATAAGFRTETKTGIALTAGQSQVVDMQLTVGSQSSTVEVRADTSLIDTGSANIATTLSSKEVADLPNIGRNPFVLATLAAGVVDAASGGYFYGKASQFTLGGVSVQITTDGSAGHNRLTLDGIPDDPAERFSGATYAGFVPSPEAVQEVKVQTSIFDAQIGHGNGTVTNTVVRSGSNALHGSAYYVFQNTYLNANTYEKSPNQNAADPATRTPRSNDQLSQTGFVIDGPVVLPRLYDGRNKTFFMVAYERYASHSSLNYQSRVPTAAEVSGDFSALCNSFNSAGLCTSGIQLYDPLSPIDASGNRTVFFPNNNIASRINPTGAALASYLPLPNVPGAAATASFNYISNQTTYPFTLPSFIMRIDQAIGSRNKFNAIFFKSDLSQIYPHQGFPKEVAPTGYGYTVYRNNIGGSLDDIHQFSSSLVLDSRFGVIYHPFGLVYPDNAGYDISKLDIAGSYPYTSFPGISSSTDNYAGLAAGSGGQVSEDTTGSLEEILTKVIGTHNIRMGFEGNLLRYNVQNPQSGFVGSSASTPGFVFDRRFTQMNSVSANVGAEANSGDPIASLLLGDPSTVSYNITPAYALQQVYMAPFMQDDWRLTDKLTLNLGLRYDYESPLTERYNKQVSNFCTTCTNPLQASVPSLPLKGGLEFTSPSDRFPYPRDLNNIQPRLGAAYQAFPNTVVRGGFGIIYFNTIETPVGTGFSQLTTYNNYLTSAPLNTLSNPFPTGVALPQGSALGLSTALGQSITYTDPHHVQPKSTQYSVSVQQQFPGNIAFQVAYVGTRPTRLEVNHNINVLPEQYYNQGQAGITYLNAAVPNPLAGTLPQATNLNGPTIAQNLLLLPYPEFGGVTENYSSIGSAPYNALQIQVSVPLRHDFSLQGNLSWDKVMLHTSYLNPYDTHLSSVQDPNPNVLANIFGIYEFPKFERSPYYERLLLGGWQLNATFRAENGPLISTPSNVNIIGDVRQPNPTKARFINTCYENTAGALVTSTTTAPACDGQSPKPAYQQRLAYTSQINRVYLPIRAVLNPLMDASLFKQFQLHQGISFEIRGEFFNILNSANFGGPNTSIGNSAFGTVVLTQANDPRIGQLTGRLNF